MRKFSLELPKYRLQMQVHLIKRRKPLLSEPLIPTAKIVNRKYRSGSKLGRIVRHISEHKIARKFFVGNMAAVFMATAFIPTASTEAYGDFQPKAVIEVQNTLRTEKSIQYPLENYKVNQGYSYFHRANDLGAPVGSPVKPVKAGTVEYAGYRKDGYGNLVILNHGQGLDSYYAHLGKIEVTEGENVTTSTEIGTVGMTGHTTGPHLHLEIHQNGASLNPVSVLSR